MQNTLKSSVRLDGIGLHGGRPARVTIRPAPADHGIRFRRTDLPAGSGTIPALWSSVVPSALCTMLTNPSGASVSTVEHLMAALAGCGIHNALVEIDGPEVPILDGSAAPFVRAFLAAGLRRQRAALDVIRILQPVEVREGAAHARLEPAETLEIRFRIDFPDTAIGEQSLGLELGNGSFVRELSDSRTFCRMSDVESMLANGLALGGTLENAVVFDGEKILNPGGLRRSDEPVRHKMLDALGDLALAGAPILGRYIGNRAGHALTNRLLHVLFTTPGAWQRETCSTPVGRRLPGAGVCHADLPATCREAA